MSKSLNAKQERFCQEFIIDQSLKHAAERAGYKQPHVKGAQLMAEDEVKARVAELQAKAAERNEITVDSMIEQIDADRTFAREHKNPSAAVQASIAKAKISGNWTDHVQIEDGKSDAQLAEALGTLLAPILGQDSVKIKAAVAALLKGETLDPDILGGLGTLH